MSGSVETRTETTLRSIRCCPIEGRNASMYPAASNTPPGGVGKALLDMEDAVRRASSSYMRWERRVFRHPALWWLLAVGVSSEC